MSRAQKSRRVRRGAGVRGEVQQRTDPTRSVPRGLRAQRLQRTAEIRRISLLHLRADVLVVPRGSGKEQVVVGIEHLVRAHEQRLPEIGHPHILNESFRIGAEPLHQRIICAHRVERRLRDLAMRPPGEGVHREQDGADNGKSEFHNEWVNGMNRSMPSARNRLPRIRSCAATACRRPDSFAGW